MRWPPGARRAWLERAAHFDLNRRLSLMFALPALIGLGMLGQVLAMQSGYHMATTRSFQLANGLWVVALVMLLAVDMPLSARLAGQSRAAAGSDTGGEPVGWIGALGRWRIGNAVQLAVFLLTLWVMVSPWKH